MPTKLSTTQLGNMELFKLGRTDKIGIFGHTIANYIIREFNKKRNQHKERSTERVRAVIVPRGRGHRNIYLEDKSKGENRYWNDNKSMDFYKLDCRRSDLPIEYAPMVALYLRVYTKCHDKIEKQQQARQYVIDIIETIKHIF